MAGFLGAVRELPENALALREWRVLAHHLGSWRAWLGLRSPGKDARAWGVHLMVWAALAPYLVWCIAAVAHGLAPEAMSTPPPAGMPSLDIGGAVMVLLGFELALLSVASMAPAVCREHERETWETLRVSIPSAHALVLGLIAGRLVPLLAAYLLAGCVWLVLLPHYAELLRPYCPFRMGRLDLATLLWQSALFAAACGMLALLFSSLLERSGPALVTGIVAALVLASTVLLLGLLPPGVPADALFLALVLGVTGAAYRGTVRAVEGEGV